MQKWTMVIFFVLGFIIYSQAQTKPWVAPSTSNANKNPFSGNEDATKKGKAIFTQMCSMCHGVKGRGDGMAGTALTPKPANLTSDKVQSQSDGAIFWKITEGRTPMASYKTVLTEEQRWQVINYIRTLKK